ncbi:hypothetical protein ACFQBQ_13450 [Granulicella cerasi]|uniref:DUF4412 domain-containing protein n=1 Tax=Granulicella cerasi TaxID=741063 RepID=A0ABW1ZCJ1_9BACT|nr:hypothetical protein [Granulicella cerasi]
MAFRDAILAFTFAAPLIAQAPANTPTPSRHLFRNDPLVGASLENMRIDKNRPFSVTENETSTTTGTDGRKRTTTTVIHFSRDSEGRVRQESQHTPQQGEPYTFITIFDPIALLYLRINAQSHTVYYSHLKPATAHPQNASSPMDAFWQKWEANQLALATGTPTQSADGSATEPLGTRKIAGVEVIGIRYIRKPSHPTASTTADARSTDEQWLSQDLHMILERRIDHPASSSTTLITSDLSVTEPAPALFRAPEGYRMVEEFGAASAAAQ